MSSRSYFAVLLTLWTILSPVCGFPADVAVMGDSLAVHILKNTDFGSRLSLCTELGKRSDPRMMEVIAYLRNGIPPRSTMEGESLLLALLGGLLDPGLGRDAVSIRFRANQTELDVLIDRLPEIRDPLLAALLVKTLHQTKNTGHSGQVLRLMDAYLERLSHASGKLDPGRIQCVLSFMAYAGELGSADFLDPCLRIIKGSRDSVVIRGARAAAAQIALRQGSP